MLFNYIWSFERPVYMKNLNDDKEKFQKNLIYFGFCFVLIVFSVEGNDKKLIIG